MARMYYLLLVISLLSMLDAVRRPISNSQSLEEINQCPLGCLCMGESMTCSNWNPSRIPLPIPPSTTLLSLPNFPDQHINETFFYKTPDLQWLQISYGNLIDFPKLPSLPRLSFLDLSVNSIRALPAKAFAHTPYIIHLNLSSNALINVHSKFLEGLDNLRVFDLSNNPLLPVLENAFFGHVRSLNYLDLTRTNIDNANWINDLHHLYSLNLSHNNIVSLPHLNNPVIGVLDLSYNPLASFPNLGKIPSISELYVAHTAIFTLELIAFEDCGHLKILDISHSNLSLIDGGIFRKCNKLQLLKLSYNYNLQRVQHLAFQGLNKLTKLFLNNSPHLHELEANILAYTPNLKELHLENTALQVLPFSLTLLHNLSFFNIENTKILCNCYAHWVPQWLERSNHSNWQGVHPVQCHNDVIRSIENLSNHIEELECEQTEISPNSQLVLASWEESAILDCNATGNPTPRVIWQTATHQFLIHNKSEHDTWINHQISQAMAIVRDDTGGKFTVLQSGQILIRNVNRGDVGRYKCFAYNAVSNASTITVLGIEDTALRSLIVETNIFGFSCAALFFLTTLIVQLIRYIMDRLGWECCCCKNRLSSRTNQIKQLLESVEFYKSAQLEKLRENYTSQVTNIKDSCYQQMERVRDSYAHQSKNLKELCDYSTQQITGARDQYLDQVNKIRDYSTGQMNRVRENYVFQRQRIRKFSAQQLVRLRETYKYQQKTLNKILETLPDLYIQNCRTGACQRTDSMIFDEIDGLDMYYKIDFLDNQSFGSDYYTPSSTLTRQSKNKHHSRNPSNISGGTIYQDTITRQSFGDTDMNSHSRYHNRSSSLATPAVHRSESLRGHTRSISATQASTYLFYPKSPLLEENMLVGSENCLNKCEKILPTTPSDPTLTEISLPTMSADPTPTRTSLPTMSADPTPTPIFLPTMSPDPAILSCSESVTPDCCLTIVTKQNIAKPSPNDKILSDSCKSGCVNNSIEQSSCDTEAAKTGGQENTNDLVKPSFETSL